jgi:hypothetical protein
MHAVWLCYNALTAALTKKTTIGNCQRTIADFAIDDPALLEINRKIAVIHQKKRPLFVCCLSVFWTI